jgi:hypothetical protein
LRDGESNRFRPDRRPIAQSWREKKRKNLHITTKGKIDHAWSLGLSPLK